MKTVVMSLVGANNFATIYKDPTSGKEGPGELLAWVWIPAHHNVFYRLEGVLRKQGIQTKLMGYFSPTVLDVLPYCQKTKEERFPDCIAEMDTKTTLFVNAWDPLSVPGNGNEWDDSLDGFIGRITNIAVNGSGMTNPDMQYVALSLN